MKTFFFFAFLVALLLTGCVSGTRYSSSGSDDLYYSRDEQRVYREENYEDDYEDEAVYEEDDVTVYDNYAYIDNCYSCLTWNVGFGRGWNYGWWNPYYSVWSPGWGYYGPYYSAYFYDPFWGWNGWGRPGVYVYDVSPRQYGPRSQRDNDLVNIPGNNYNQRRGVSVTREDESGGTGNYTSRPRRTSTSGGSSGSENVIDNNYEAPAYRSRPRSSEIGIGRPPVTVSPLEPEEERGGDKAPAYRSRPRREERPPPANVTPSESQPSHRERTREYRTAPSSPNRESAPSRGSGSSSSPSRDGGSRGSDSGRPTRSPR